MHIGSTAGVMGAKRVLQALALTLLASSVSGFCASLSLPRKMGPRSAASVPLASEGKVKGLGISLTRGRRQQTGVVMMGSMGSSAVRTVLVAGSTGRVGALVCEEVHDRVSVHMMTSIPCICIHAFKPVSFFCTSLMMISA